MSLRIEARGCTERWLNSVSLTGCGLHGSGRGRVEWSEGSSEEFLSCVELKWNEDNS